MDSIFVSLARDLAIFAKDTFNNIAPNVWAIARQSVYADMAIYIVVFLSCVIGISILLKLCKICLENYEDGESHNDWNIVATAIIIGMIGLSITGTIMLGLTIQKVVAVNYYTLLKIVSLIK